MLVDKRETYTLTLSSSELKTMKIVLEFFVENWSTDDHVGHDVGDDVLNLLAPIMGQLSPEPASSRVPVCDALPNPVVTEDDLPF